MASSRKKSAPSVGPLYLIILLLLFVTWLSVMAIKWSNAPELRPEDLMVLGVATGFCLLTYGLFRFSNYQGDRILPALVLLLAGLGFMIQFRLGNLNLMDYSRYANFAYPIGFVSFFVSWLVFRNGRHAKLAGWALPALIAAVAVLGVILMTGQRFRGAVFMTGQLNPAEIVKLLLAIFMAGVITDFRKPLQQTVAGIPAPPARSLLTIGALWIIPIGLLVLQRDLGMIILLNTVFLILVFMATGRWGYLVLGGTAAGLVGYVGFHTFHHARVRLIGWHDPFADPTGKGWQILQSLSAMFTGGLTGSGIGAGSPTVVPIAASDFVYAAFAEEAGFIGCVMLVGAYLLLFYRGFRVADQIRNPFSQLLAAALITLIALQTLMNLGGVTKAIPLTGITLPLLSHGGSSLVTTLTMLGLLVAMSEPAGKGARR
jgi:cell division protein FtsW (lipid II flippase)